MLRDWFFSIKLINKNQKKRKIFFFPKYLGANLHEKVSSALETVRPSQKLFIRAISRFAQLRKVLIWQMTSEVRKCLKWRFWGVISSVFWFSRDLTLLVSDFNIHFIKWNVRALMRPTHGRIEMFAPPQGFPANWKKTNILGISTKNVIEFFFLKIHKKFKSS